MISTEFVSLVLETYRVTDRFSASADRFSREGLFAMIHPEHDGIYPSTNGNRVVIHADIPSTDDDLDRVESAYAAAGVKRHFAWIIPYSRSEAMAQRLTARGWEEFHGPDYLTLARAPELITHETKGLVVRRLEVAEAHALGPQLQVIQGGKPGFVFLGSVGQAGCDHFAAFDGDVPIACAMSVRVGPGTYLSSAATLPEFTRRGAQCALIAARVSHAKETGASLCFVETLSMLGTSLANLERMGFRQVMAARVFQRVTRTA